MIDYATLKIIWWLLVGVLLVGFAIMDGHGAPRSRRCFDNDRIVDPAQANGFRMSPD
ncbi:hypothetical protein ACG04R_13890 [Roseateles sp. BYS78W]|uniref:Uncharacterized protein n=1 Tax=Pelomonas candidula TaxID=3299025 RepID=A0ABW7HCZ7_9BURK